MTALAICASSTPAARRKSTRSCICASVHVSSDGHRTSTLARLSSGTQAAVRRNSTRGSSVSSTLSSSIAGDRITTWACAEVKREHGADREERQCLLP